LDRKQALVCIALFAFKKYLRKNKNLLIKIIIETIHPYYSLKYNNDSIYKEF